MVVLRSISRVNTPPSVSMPSDSGVTSSSSTSLTSPFSTAPWIAAPIATTSSGLTLRAGSRPKNCFTVSMTLGMRVMPPTRITSSISPGRHPGVLQRGAAGLQGALRSGRRPVFQLGAGQLHHQVLRPGGVGGDERQVDLGLLGGRQLDLGLLRGFLQPLQRQRSRRRSMPCSRLNSSASQSITRWSKSSPPRKVSPLVDFTSNTPSPISSMEMSKVPPPRS